MESMVEPMRILIIHNYYQQFGGTDAVVKEEATLLRAHGHDVRMYTKHSDEIKEYSLSQKIRFIPNTIYSRSSADELNIILDEFKPDVTYIHAVQPLLSYSCYITLNEKNIPIVQMLHDFRFLCPAAFCFANNKICEKCFDGNYAYAVLNKCYRNSYFFSSLYAVAVHNARYKLNIFDKITKFICPTEFFRSKFSAAGIPAEKLLVKPHYIDTSKIVPAFKPGPYILYLGRLSPEKGVMTLLQAMTRLPNIKLFIMGSGPSEQQMKTYVQKKSLQNVEFLGFRKDNEKYDIILGSAFTIMPSIWNETFGLTALDAYACGKPVVASNIGSLPYVVQDNITGLLFEAGNPEDLTKVIASLYENHKLIEEMGRNAKQVQKKQFSPEASYERLMEIFGEVTK